MGEHYLQNQAARNGKFVKALLVKKTGKYLLVFVSILAGGLNSRQFWNIVVSSRFWMCKLEIHCLYTTCISLSRLLKLSKKKTHKKPSQTIDHHLGKNFWTILLFSLEPLIVDWWNQIVQAIAGHVFYGKLLSTASSSAKRQQGLFVSSTWQTLSSVLLCPCA